MERRSGRFGNAHLLHPRLDEVPGVMWSRASLGGELNRAGALAGQLEALDGAVVKRGGRDFGTVALDREAVVLTRDEDAVRAQIEHRVVRAAVPERQLERLETGGEGEQLVPETDAETRYVANQPGDARRLRWKRGRVPRPVREDDAV